MTSSFSLADRRVVYIQHLDYESNITQRQITAIIVIIIRFSINFVFIGGVVLIITLKYIGGSEKFLD
jgi:hypothetical protein